MTKQLIFMSDEVNEKIKLLYILHIIYILIHLLLDGEDFGDSTLVNFSKRSKLRRNIAKLIIILRGV